MAPTSHIRFVSDALGKRKREHDSYTNASLKKLVSNAAIRSSLTTFPSSPYLGNCIYTTSASILSNPLQLSHIQSSSLSLSTRPAALHALQRTFQHRHQNGSKSIERVSKVVSLKASNVTRFARSENGAGALETRSKFDRLEAEIKELRECLQAMQRNASQWQPQVQEGNVGKLKEQYGQIVQKVDEQRDLRRIVDDSAIAGAQRGEANSRDGAEGAQKPGSSRGAEPKEGSGGGLPGKKGQTPKAPAVKPGAVLLERLDNLLKDDREQKSRDLEIKLTEANLAVQTQQRLKLTEEVEEEESEEEEGVDEVTEEVTEDGTEEAGETEDEEDESTEERFGFLTEEEDELVDQILNKPASNEQCVLHEASNLELSRTQLHCLRPETWLNDETTFIETLDDAPRQVINLYMVLLKERESREDFQDEGDHPVCHFFNSFFYNKLRMDSGEYSYKQVQRWTRRTKYKLRKCDKVVVPIHQGLHWALAVINLRERQLEYFDSVCDGHGYPFSTKASPETVLEDLAQYIEDESKDKGTGPLDTSDWRRVFHKDTPNQKNSSDCGMFMLKFADFVSKDAPITFSQEDMWYFRRKLVVELVHLRAD